MSESELRAMVREVLHEALGRRGQAKHVAEAKAESVRIASDADLAAFVQRVVKLLGDPAAANGVRSGRHRFTLGGAATTPPVPERAAGGNSIVLDGTVTEAKINKCAGAGAVVLAADAVITPLARDRARTLGLKIERKR